MSSRVDSRGQGGPPAWDEGAKQQATKRWLGILIAGVTLFWLILLGYVFVLAPIAKAEVKELAAGASLAVVLAPVLAAAAGVERMLETIFNIVENTWKTLVAFLGRGLSWLKSAETELAESRQWLADVSKVYAGRMEALKQDLNIDANVSLDTLTGGLRDKMLAAGNLMKMAEGRLATAEKNLAEATTSDRYRSAKTAAAIVLGLMLGVIVAAVGQLQMFAMLGIAAVPERIDVLITGLIIGSGSYPVHSLVGILQQTKDTLDSAKGALSRAGYARQPAPTDNRS